MADLLLLYEGCLQDNKQSTRERKDEKMAEQALLLVDVQNDFFPGGALPTPNGDSIIRPVNRLIGTALAHQLPIFATRDWHPEDHCSFEAQGGPWPPHCIQDTEGAQFHPAVRMPRHTKVISKADERDKEAYSGFDKTDLAGKLRDEGISRLIVAGLATDVCVKNTVLDALKEGFEVFVVENAVSGIDNDPGDSDQALWEMQKAGAHIVHPQYAAA